MDFSSHNNNSLIYLAAHNISTRHAFTTRYGEPSDGKFSQESLDALCKALELKPENIVSSKQVHGKVVRVVSQLTPNSSLLTPNSVIEADAMITQTPGVALMIFTADCVPILLSDPVRHAVGAVHAGWRGTAQNIVSAAVCKMESEFGCSPADICVAIGPCISKCCFKTDADVPDALCSVLNEDSERCIAAKGEKYMIDLKEANRLMLIGAGVREDNITVSDDCTVCTDNGSKYWSHRRQGTNRGSQATVIVM